jgi:hypothetical protein
MTKESKNYLENTVNAHVAVIDDIQLVDNI